MKTVYFKGITIVLLLLFSQVIGGQTCSGVPYNSPGSPSSCTYTFTSSGWVNASGSPIAAPTTNNSSESICIRANNTNNFSLIKGTFYVAPGVTYSGSINGFNNGSKLIIEGTMSLPTSTSFSSTEIYIESTGTFTYPASFAPSGSTTVKNKGVVTIMGALSTSGSALIVNYQSARINIKGDASINSPIKNCGILDIFGSISGTGGSGLENYCSVYARGNISFNSDFTNNGLIILDGNLTVNSSTLFNYGTLVATNLVLTNDKIVGNNNSSLLIVRQNAQLLNGASITGNLFYDVDDGGGFDSVCASCTQDVDIVTSIVIPSTNEEILANCGADIIVNPYLEESKLDFDGIDDYVTTPSFINGLSNVTIMAWVLSDTGNTANMTIAGEDVGCRLWLQNGNKPSFTIKTAAVAAQTINAPSVIKHNEWHHITGTFSGATGIMTLYIDGVFSTSLYVGAMGSPITNTAASNGNFSIGRRSSGTGSEYFKGDLDEVRVFNTVLTASQIQRMVYQEIENNSGVVKGKVINKNIVDATTNASVAWSSLLAYYPLSNIISFSRTKDFSSNNRITKVKNVTSFQDETAPLPYVTKAGGAWTSQSTWLNGDVWDIEDITNMKEWSIVKILNEVTASNTVKTLGLIIDTNGKLTINGDNLVSNSWYLELNGTLDLLGDSQLIQTTTSDLVTSAVGKILRRQEGTSNAYSYNYWSSPVGLPAAGGLINNNAATNNTNNTSFKLNTLKDQFGATMQFTTSYNQVNRISTSWLYTFKNGRTYYDWAYLSPSQSLSPGVGYTQKGTGNGGTEQQYIFEGKPNNGTILINVTDTGGPGSVTNVSKTEYLLGNPYPSALDIHKFIDDNVDVIKGPLLLWQQWAGNSHNLNEYQGGYAHVNKTGACRAYQFVGRSGDNNGSQDGTIIPTRYLPVGQGFIVEIKESGMVKFNNSQRVFIKESDADGGYENGSAFFKSSNTKSKINEETEQVQVSNPMQKIRLEFNSVAGATIRKELLLGFSEITTDGYDDGYDAENYEVKNNDLNLSLEGQNMSIQAYGPIAKDKVIPLNFISSGNNTFEIEATAFEYFDENQSVYLKDNFTDTYFDLRQDVAYRFTTTQGKFNSRFEIVFQSKEERLSAEESQFTENIIYYHNDSNTLYAKKLSTDLIKLSVVNMRGQIVQEFKNLSQDELNNGLELANVLSGAYVVWFKTQSGQVGSRKFLVD
ncbi:LamG domain-containing protein [Mariniflexile sp.]|uniref:LamG domain-containing protein n=1 Tax=Mariniflexile sp. TaxID=1979402 RepID=UPI00356706DE